MQYKHFPRGQAGVPPLPGVIFGRRYVVCESQATQIPQAPPYPRHRVMQTFCRFHGSHHFQKIHTFFLN